MPHASSPLIDCRALDESARSLLDRKTRVVGWGTGSVFDYFRQLHPVRLDHLVDSDHTRWGRLRHGLEVVDPSVLTRHDPATTFVIIYSSFWPQIQTQLAGIAPVRSLPASAVFADAAVRARLAQAERLSADIRPPARRDEADAIVVQGPVIPDVTERVLRATRSLYPENLVVLSTWSDTVADELDPLLAFVDELVVTSRPEPPGIQNRNCQIVSTRRGIERARAHGARMVLKTRSDLAVLEPHVFDRARWWLDRVDDGPARAAGLQRRLIVPASFTRKYLLYHPSDLVMLGTAEDMARYWNAPLDPRTGTLLAPQWRDRTLSSVNLDGNPTESYLGLQLCRSLGRPVGGTLQDSWAFYRDLFAVVDNGWFGVLWFKNLSIPDAALQEGVRQTVSQAFWEHLQTDAPVTVQDVADIDPAATTLSELARVAA